jgi:hypothetical protein
VEEQNQLVAVLEAVEKVAEAVLVFMLTIRPLRVEEAKEQSVELVAAD